MLPSRHLLAQSQQTINRTIFRTISCVPNICLHFISDEVVKMLIFDMSHDVYKNNFCMKYFFNKRGLVLRKLQVCSELLRNLNWKTSFFLKNKPGKTISHPNKARILFLGNYLYIYKYNFKKSNNNLFKFSYCLFLSTNLTVSIFHGNLSGMKL